MAYSWALEAQSGDLTGLVRGVLKSRDVGDNEVLVNLRAASLNYRELAIAKVDTSARIPVSPCS